MYTPSTLSVLSSTENINKDFAFSNVAQVLHSKAIQIDEQKPFSMAKFKRIALLCLIVTHFNCAQSSRYEGSTDCDFARSSYVQLERSLWEKYVDKVSVLSRNERLYKIFNQHFIFVQQFMDGGFEPQDFSVLDKFYEWNIIEPDVKSIHMLFKDHFRHRLELELDTNDINGRGFDERANLDLAETVLTDPLWPINATLEKIQNNIYNQGLYYKAKSVRALFLTPVSLTFGAIEFNSIISL